MSSACIECRIPNSLRIDNREGTVVCMECGLVQQSRLIDETNEARNFAKDSSSRGGDNTMRVGAASNPLLPDAGMAVYIGKSDRGDNSLARWGHRSIQTGIGRSLENGFRRIDELAHVLNLQKIVEENAQKLFAKVLEQKQLKGRSMEAVVAAILFRVAKEQGQPFHLKTISNILAIEKKEITKCTSVIKKLIPSTITNVYSAQVFAQQLADKLQLSETYRRAAADIAKASIDLGLVTGKDPSSVASAAVYMAAKLGSKNITYRDISDHSKMKDVTIRSCYKDMYPRRFELCQKYPQQIELLPEPQVKIQLFYVKI